MPRPLRPQVAGGRYHVTARGNRRQLIFRNDGDRHLFLQLAAETVRRDEWRLSAYCLLDNHYHLLLESRKANLSVGMQWLNARFAQWTNHLHGADGHLFQGRFRSMLIERDEHLLEAARYIALNPVRAGICRSALSWPWSSYPATVGAVRAPAFLDPSWLLSFFDDDPLRARAEFHLFVGAAETMHRAGGTCPFAARLGSDPGGSRDHGRNGRSRPR